MLIDELGERAARMLTEEVAPTLGEIAQMTFEPRLNTGYQENEKDDIREACEAADAVKRYLCGCVDGLLAKYCVHETEFSGDRSAAEVLESYLRGGSEKIGERGLEDVAEARSQGAEQLVTARN